MESLIMNQIYRVIWSRVKCCYIVVSELTKSVGRENFSVVSRHSLYALVCVITITGCLMTSVAEASFNGGIGSSTVKANSIAVGDDAKTTEEYTIALGSRSKAKNIYAIAMGDLAEATGQGATAIGSQSKSTALHSLAVGDQAQAMAVNSSAYGILSKALSSHSVAIGNEASVGKGDPDSVSSQNGIAIGNGANVTVNPATATPGITDKSGGIAIGHDATTKDINTIALGTGTIGQGAQAVAIGRNARTIANNGVAIGNEARTQSTNGFALGNNARAGFDENNVLVGRDNDQAFGSNARAWGGSSMAFGNNAKAANGGAIAMGNGSQSRGDWGVAIGNGAKALATGARALGANSKASGVNAAAIGWDSEASGASSIAVGEMVKSTGTNSVAIGTGAKATNENAVALGAGSETALTVVTSSATINGTVHNFAGVNPASTVSVGKAGSERTITNVAAGRISVASTDAINGSQLYAVTSEIDKGVAYAGDVKAAAAATNKFTRKLGEQTNIVGGVVDASKLTDGNIGVVSDGTDTLNIKLAKNVKVDSVTTGNTVINDNGLTVSGKNYVTNNGINANNQKVTNVADGHVAAGSKDAVNGGQLHDAKNEVINKGLRFDADNNSEKTNKLGSKVTINGDNNITTEITQTGDDTKIGVKLNEDIYVKAVTATDTMKAGGVTMGSQTSGGTTGNYVTGLDNKTWNVTNPTAVSGRAATEDQLKTVTEAINNQSAAATDYRLVKNASSADGSYTVDTSGNIDLTVEDKNHAGQKETVKLKDIASQSKLDDVIAKGLQFDANAGGTKTNKLGSKITVKGEGTAADIEYSGENLKTFITQDPVGNTTIDVKMNKNLKVETIVATGENGKDGKIGINGKDGVTTNISVTRDGKPGIDGAPGTITTRIVYEKPDGTKEEVATLNDGMKYGGDTGNVIKKKLNGQVNVVGGITDENKLTTEDNLGVVSDGSNNLKVRLAKALKGLESVTTGDTVMNNNGVTINNGAAGNPVSLTKNGLDNGGNKITNVAAGVNGTDAVNVNQLNTVAGEAAKHTTVKAKDSNVTITERPNASGGTEYTIGLGDKVTLGTDPTKQVSIDGTTGIIKAGDKVTIDGMTGNIDAGKVKINGKDGTVNGLTNKTWDPNNITSGQAATEDQLKEVDNKITNTSTELTNKGMDFAGNEGEFHRNLGEKVTIKGEGTKAASEYSGENIRTFADLNGNLTVKMDKNLKTETIVATGENGKDGKIGINGKDGVTTNISVTRDGKPGVDGAPGTTTTRIVYEKPDGTKEDRKSVV